MAHNESEDRSGLNGSPSPSRKRYSIRESEIFVTVYPSLIECVTWASGYRYVRRYIGYTRRQAIREFRADFTEDYPNP